MRRLRTPIATGMAVALAVGALGACTKFTKADPSTTTTISDVNATIGAPTGTEPETTAGTGVGTGAGTGGPQPSDAFQPAALEWQTCTDPSATDPTLECATLTVPADYTDPAGSTIDLALVKSPGSSDNRDGAVLFNPGGPGGSGFDYVASGGPTITSELAFEHLDLIGFDPRGVDRSGGIRCQSDADLDKYAYPDTTPDTPAEEAFLEESDEAFATACRAEYGDTLAVYSTVNTARDMDVIRRALGDDTISFLGISYGTYLGAVYATLFPAHVRALVLDSAFEPTGDTLEEQYKTQLVGFENAFDDFAAWCQDTDECSFRQADVGAAWDALRIAMDDSPLTNSDGRIGNQGVLDRGTLAALYSKTEWPVLGAALADAVGGDPGGLFQLADGYFSRDADGHYATIQQSNVVINCASGIEADVPPDPEALAAELRSIAPRFGADITADDLDDGDGCSDLMPKQPIDTLEYNGSAPIVVIGGKNDPATPFRWAEEMAAAMGPSARLVTYTGEGHGQLLASTCVTAIEATVLTDLELPASGTVCDPDPEIEQPSWWNAVPVPDGVDAVFVAPAIAAALGINPTQLFGELRTSSGSQDAVLAAYSDELEAAGLSLVGSQEPIPLSQQDIYQVPNGDIFSVLVAGAEAFAAEASLQSVADQIPAGKILVILLYIPQ